MSILNHEQIRAYLHLGRGQLNAAEQAALDAHLAGCADCRRYAGEVTGLQTRLTEAMRVRWKRYSPSPVINEQVQARLRRKIWYRQLWRLANSVAAAMATLIVILSLGWLAWQTRPLPDRPVARATMTAPASSLPPAPSVGDWTALPGLATFGDQAKLLGYSLSVTSFAPGDTVEVTIYGQTRSANYTFFALLFGGDNTFPLRGRSRVAQTDAPGLEASCPQVGRHSAGLVVTCLPLVLPNPLPAGSYQLRVGAYDQAGGQRMTTPDGRETILLTTLQIGALPAETSPPTPILAPTPTTYSIPASCPVTLPNGSTPPGEQPSPTYHGNGQLWTALWPEGAVLIPPQMVQPDGSSSMKWGWWRGVEGQLTIEGRRLDASASPLGAVIPDGYGDTGFQPGGLIFSTEGCWEVTGKVGQAELTFVVYVVKVGASQ